jgi:hypothetical protein
MARNDIPAGLFCCLPGFLPGFPVRIASSLRFLATTGWLLILITAWPLLGRSVQALLHSLIDLSFGF